MYDSMYLNKCYNLGNLLRNQNKLQNSLDIDLLSDTLPWMTLYMAESLFYKLFKMKYTKVETQYNYKNTRKTWNTDFIIVCQNVIGLHS